MKVYQPEPLKQDNIYFMWFTPNSGPSICCRGNRDSSEPGTFYYLLSNFCDPKRILHQFSVLNWQELQMAQFPIAAAYFLQCSMCCEFRDALLYSFVVKNCYLNYSCSSICLNQSGPSDQPSERKYLGDFHYQGISAHWILFPPFSVNLRDSCSWKF